MAGLPRPLPDAGRIAFSAVELSAIVPLPVSVVDNRAAALAPLTGEAPLVRVVSLMLGPAAVPEARGVVVATAEPLVDDVRASLAAGGMSSVAVAVAEGSGGRTGCVAAGLKYLASSATTLPRYVLLHDYRHPLAPADLRDRVIAQLRNGCPVVLPAIAVTDSIKAVDAQGSVTATVDRSLLRTVQYPRGFAVDRLAELIARCDSDDFDEVDEAIHAGLQIAFVDGDPDAFAVELPTDARLVEALIARRQDR